MEIHSFLLSRQILDVSIAVLIGKTFSDVLESLVSNVLMPLLASITGKVDFKDMSFILNNQEINYGLAINSLLYFFVTLIAFFYLIIRPLWTKIQENDIKQRVVERKKEEEIQKELEEEKEEQKITLLDNLESFQFLS